MSDIVIAARLLWSPKYPFSSICGAAHFAGERAGVQMAESLGIKQEYLTHRAQMQAEIEEENRTRNA